MDERKRASLPASGHSLLLVEAACLGSKVISEAHRGAAATPRAAALQNTVSGSADATHFSKQARSAAMARACRSLSVGCRNGRLIATALSTS